MRKCIAVITSLSLVCGHATECGALNLTEKTVQQNSTADNTVNFTELQPEKESTESQVNSATNTGEPVILADQNNVSALWLFNKFARAATQVADNPVARGVMYAAATIFVLFGGYKVSKTVRGLIPSQTAAKVGATAHVATEVAKKTADYLATLDLFSNINNVNAAAQLPCIAGKSLVGKAEFMGNLLTLVGDTLTGRSAGFIKGLTILWTDLCAGKHNALTNDGIMHLIKLQYALEYKNMPGDDVASHMYNAFFGKVTSQLTLPE